MLNNPRMILIHHSGSDLPKVQFNEIDKWHKARKFPLSSLGFYIGYHLVIESNGVVRRARVDTERDCDAIGQNFNSLSVCLVGNFNKKVPTLEQEKSLAIVLRDWIIKWKLKDDIIFPHRKFNKTDCYGKNLSDNWARLVYLKSELERLNLILKLL